ncbi:hypothetical protein LUZ60_001762 [Juncus effusus]|nr:hypothetical protein LUZ60_001762 [Juncus effusus]
MASPLSDSKNHHLNSEETEVTSEHRGTEAEDPRRDDGGGVDLDYPLVRHNSIYSLTLDEIQNTVCEPGRNFGSMNMDEFLTNIWNAEEGQAQAPAQTVAAVTSVAGAEINSGGLQRQGSLSVPAPLSRKTVEEVWTEINQVQDGPTTIPTAQHGDTTVPPANGVAGRGRQATFGEMTLEDFLIKAGVVREPMVTIRPPPPPSNFAPTPAMTGFPMGAELGGIYPPAMVMNGMMMGSPDPTEGMGDEVAGFDRSNGRKRTAGGAGLVGGDGSTVEKVVERRQRRMIKNRESAARSRARKQAYTVELEAELNQLKEENMRLKEEEKKVLALRRQMLLESMAERSHANVEKARATLRRSTTCVW